MGACEHGSSAGAGLPGLAPSGPPDLPFSDGVARGYRLLAEYETWRDNDPEAAAIFRKKADMAASGDVPPPDTPDPRQFTAAELQELYRGRGMLTAAREALDENDDHPNAVMVAEAQVNYDCWLERTAEKSAAAQWCRERLFSALDGLELQRTNEYRLQFQAEDAVPDPAGLSVVRAAAAAFERRPEWRMHVTGYGDGGRGDKPALLGMRRALAVRNALAQNGVDLDHITIGAKTGGGNGGLSSLFGGDSKGCRGCVELVLLPAHLDHPDDGPDIRKIAPHYFGSEAQGW